ncbi:MAG TPA: type II secretion system protein GspM [Spirochaetota bacterium]|nr:type II secretion system protein GspM [Spirochaetota bacterium]
MIKISAREKRLLKIFGAITAGTLLYLLVVNPYLSLMESSRSSIAGSRQDLARLETLYEEYRQIKQQKTRYDTLLGNREENITTLIEQWSTSADVARHIAYTRRTQSNIQNKYLRISTDVKIDGVPIQKFIRFLHEIESSGRLLKVSYLRLYQGLKGADTYDVIMKIDSYTLQ